MYCMGLFDKIFRKKESDVYHESEESKRISHVIAGPELTIDKMINKNKDSK
jgi:hypothetical protein